MMAIGEYLFVSVPKPYGKTFTRVTVDMSQTFSMLSMKDGAITNNVHFTEVDYTQTDVILRLRFKLSASIADEQIYRANGTVPRPVAS